MVAEWYQLYSQVLSPLDEMNYDVLNIVDVGVNKGQLKHFLGNELKTPLYFVGVEPNTSLIQTTKYDVMFSNAVDDVDFPEQRTFYINEDSDCSSLLKINEDVLTYDFEERNNKDKWYVSRTINNIKETKDVTVVSMKHILDTLPKFKNEFIHLLKVDVQGVDIRVVKSMREYLNNTLFAMVEIATSKNKNTVLYEGQTTIEDDIKTMDELGFKHFYTINYNDSTPEADLIFINKKYIENE